MTRRSDADCVAELRDARRVLPAWFGRRAKRLLGHPDYGVRQAAIEAVGRCGASKYVTLLSTALRERADRDYALQVAAARALGMIGDLAVLPDLMEAWIGDELLNVRRVARREIDRVLSAHRLRGRQGFGDSHDRLLKENHPFAPGSDSVHARQIDEQVRLTEVTLPFLYDSPAFCRYCAGQRPVLERALEALLPRAARPLAVANRMLALLCRGMAHPTEGARWDFEAWWREAASGAVLEAEWEEEAILASGTGSCDAISRCFLALCRVRQIPGRLVIWYGAGGKRQHVMAELFLDGRWTVWDPALGLAWQRAARDIRADHTLVGKAKRVSPVSKRRREMIACYAAPEMFAQAGIVPIDRMGLDP